MSFHTINHAKNIFFVFREITITFVATWHNRHVLWVRLVKETPRGDMIFCLRITAAISATVV
jgi:hypothetical protein